MQPNSNHCRVRIGMLIALATLCGVMLAACGSPSYCGEIGKRGKATLKSMEPLEQQIINSRPTDSEWINKTIDVLASIEESANALQRITAPDDAAHLQRRVNKIGEDMVTGARLLSSVVQSPDVRTKTDFENSRDALRGVNIMTSALIEFDQMLRKGGALHIYCSAQ